MGGTRRLNSNMASNGIHICVRCHMYVESERDWARSKGFLILQHADPEFAPIWWRCAQWSLLKADGTRDIIEKRDKPDLLW